MERYLRFGYKTNNLEDKSFWGYAPLEENITELKEYSVVCQRGEYSVCKNLGVVLPEKFTSLDGKVTVAKYYREEERLVKMFSLEDANDKEQCTYVINYFGKLFFANGNAGLIKGTKVIYQLNDEFLFAEIRSVCSTYNDEIVASIKTDFSDPLLAEAKQLMSQIADLEKKLEEIKEIL